MQEQKEKKIMVCCFIWQSDKEYLNNKKIKISKLIRVLIADYVIQLKKKEKEVGSNVFNVVAESK